jgi:DNA-binding GntR family transcriptional regulator
MSADRTGTFTAPPSLVEALATDIRRRILEGRYAPGERIPEGSITSELGVSRPPVREAMRLLQREGLLAAIPRRGVVVTPLTAVDVREIYSVRHALEALAVELSVPLEGPKRMAPLRGALRDMEQATSEGRHSELPLLNLRFHQALAGLPGNTRLSQAYDALAGQLQMCMAINLRFRERLLGDPSESVARHAQLVDLIHQGDAAAVKRALDDHGDRSFLDNLEDLLAPARDERNEAAS